MGKKSAPPPPDYTGAAEKQAQASQQAVTSQTWANRADQYDPWGSSTWSQQSAVDPSTGQNVTKWTQNTQLTPEAQQALDAQMNVQNARSQQAADLIPRMTSEYGSPMDWSQLQGWGQAAQAGQLNPTTFGFGGQPRLQTGLNFSGTQGVPGADQSRQSAEDAIYGQATSRLDPQWQQSEQSLQSDLANKGISQNSDAYTRAMADFNRQKTDAYNQAQMSAITGGGAEAQRNQAMDLALHQTQTGDISNQANFANTALGQQFGFGLAQQGQAFGQQQQAGQQNFSQQMAQSQFENQMRQQQLQEAMQQRGFSLNEMNALLSGQQVQTPQFSGYSQAGQAQAPDYLSALQGQYGAQMDQTNAAQAQSAQTMQGVGAAASIAAMVFI